MLSVLCATLAALRRFFFFLPGSCGKLKQLAAEAGGRKHTHSSTHTYTNLHVEGKKKGNYAKVKGKGRHVSAHN